MRTFRYVVADVFTDTPLAGNPLAVFTDGRGLDDEEMQRLARDLNLSENVFVLPGLGRLMLQSISNRDTLVVENGVMLLALIVIGLNFIVDIACAAIDPRLRASAA
jgi:ABC-type microcin C transport system permease subunit YejB